MNISDSPIKIVEVGPRDGLQNEATPVSVDHKVALIEQLAAAGLRSIESGSFVNPNWVPQMADSENVFKQLKRKDGVSYPALVPNLKGLERALDSNVDSVNCFTAASDAFNRKNINCSTDESIEKIKPLIARCRSEGIPVRGYVSCMAGCPYQGAVDKEEVFRVSDILLELGCYEIALGDTIGVATAGHVKNILDYILGKIPPDKIGLHFHDTYGQALANVLASLEYGITTFDSSVAGLGGCPYAEGASGNVATEDLVYMLEGLGKDTGINLDLLIDAGNSISKVLGRTNASKVARAWGTTSH